MTLLEEVVASMVTARIAGATPEAAVMAGLAPALPMLEGLALRGTEAAADVFLQLLAKPAQAGYANVSGEEDARAKRAGELSASGDAGPGA